ncbi:MAG: MFS transporter [Rhodospirillaceae bacterium]|nr:MFS transporter [Rhodospirillaceae bacterium]MBT5195637.1 MFS transporter [Rhodospirillaceae bacterium]MBT5896320.1 MFS transporter [Rhodospirillaceae bacterium]MBT6426260.1 MFS transporter [Rhodospirillaceae bacterium]
MTRQLWIMVLCGVLIVLASNGLRLTFGIFLRPISVDLDISRQVFGLVIATQTLLFGLVQPIAGMVADRYGAVKVIVVGSFCYALGLWLMSLAASALDLYISLGILIGLGLSGATQVIVLGAVGKVVPNERRGVVFGTVIAAGSLGMFFFVPGIQGMMDVLGWRETLVGMAILMAVIPIVTVGLRIDPSAISESSRQSLREAIREARGHSGYVLLAAGFFVCGFHVTFIATHFPAYLADNDVSLTAAAYALGVIGLLNIIGAYSFGAAGDRFRKKNVLTLIYALRAVVMTTMLFIPINDVTALIFGATLGLLWLATVPLTSGIVAQVFGTRHFSMLFGVVFMSHQIGGFSGAWLGGVIYDMTGSYDLMWAISVALGLMAAALHWPISDQPLKRLTEQTT